MKWNSFVWTYWIFFLASGTAFADGNAEGIDEEGFVTVGGIEQWVTIKGEDRENPVVLVIHGGPGNPLSGLSDSLYAGWEKTFTLVHYDQRGAGKTYGRNLPVEELTLEILNENPLSLELLVADGVEVARYALSGLKKQKLLLTGTSWGSALAVLIYQANPVLFEAYVGVSQMVDFQENIAASYTLVRARAVEENDRSALEALDRMGPPPWTEPRNPGRLRRIVREYEMRRTDPGPELKWAFGYDDPESREAYFAGEEYSWVKFIGMEGGGFSNEVDLFYGGLEFEIPVVLIQGSEDLLTTPKVSRRYFEQLRASQKEYILVPRSGHDPNKSMLAEQFRALESLSGTEVEKRR